MKTNIYPITILSLLLPGALALAQGPTEASTPAEAVAAPETAAADEAKSAEAAADSASTDSASTEVVDPAATPEAAATPEPAAPPPPRVVAPPDSSGGTPVDVWSVAASLPGVSSGRVRTFGEVQAATSGGAASHQGGQSFSGSGQGRGGTGFVSVLAGVGGRSLRADTLDMPKDMCVGARLHLEGLTGSTDMGLGGYLELGVAKGGDVVEVPMVIGFRLYMFGVFVGPMIGANAVGGEVETIGWSGGAVEVKEKSTNFKYGLLGGQLGYTYNHVELGFMMQYEFDPKGVERSDHVAYPSRSEEYMVFLAWKF